MLDFPIDTFPDLDTPRLHLRQLTVQYAPELFRIRSDENVMRYIPRPRPQHVDEVLQLIDQIETGRRERRGLLWAMTEAQTGRLVGNLGFVNLQREHYRAEVGYLLHPDFWGQGLIGEALAAILAYGFTRLGLHSVEALIDPDNDASRRVLLRQGFVREAYFKENFYYAGRFLDTEIYSLLKSTYLAGKAVSDPVTNQEGYETTAT